MESNLGKQLASQIQEGTKELVENSGRKFESIEFDNEQKTIPSDTEKQEFSDKLVKQIEEGTKDVLKEDAEYEKIYGSKPGRAFSNTVPL